MSKRLNNGALYQAAQGKAQGHEGLHSSDDWGCDAWNNILGLHERDERYNTLHAMILRWLQNTSQQSFLSLSDYRCAKSKR